MDRIMQAEIDPAKFPDGSEYSFAVNYFDDAIVAAQTFSHDPSFSYEARSPGFYNINAFIKNNSELYHITYPYRYFPPADSLDLSRPTDKRNFSESLIKAGKNRTITPYRASASGLDFDFIFFPSDKKRLFILCPSAIIRGQFPVPYFYRWQWANQGKFPGNVIVVSDPTFNLDPQLGAGWFIGTAERDATAIFSNILRLICNVLNIPANAMTFWGSSTGGFIAIQMSACFPGSSAVSVNSQTDIHKYEGHQILYKKAFPGLNDEQINSRYGQRLNLANMIGRLSKNRVFMAQNVLDKHHYECHFLPFVKNALGIAQIEEHKGIWRPEDLPFTFWVYSHPDGHMAETAEMAEVMIQRIELNL